MKIGLISDTHGYLDPKVLEHFSSCDEVWHAGDIGTIEVADRLKSFRSFRAVYGNIDGHDIRQEYAEHERFEIDGLKIRMTHIGGSPPKYNSAVRSRLVADPPDIFICGHSHILKIMTDKNLGNMLFVNPGAAGRQGFHRMRTLIRFDIDSGKVVNLQVVELGLRGK